jgi:hypothetical protein
MPTLGDFIGQLAAAVTQARLQADMEAVRVAELYAHHPYLKHFPVPRFRLPNVEVSTPIVIKEVEDLDAAAALGTVKIQDVQEEVVNVLDRQLTRYEVRLKPQQRSTLKRKVRAGVAGIEHAETVSVDVSRFAKVASRIATSEVVKLPPAREVDVETWNREIESSLKVRLINRRKLAAPVRVLVETAQIKEVGPFDTVAQFRISLQEDAVEWTVVERDGEEDARLVPE